MGCQLLHDWWLRLGDSVDHYCDDHDYYDYCWTQHHDSSNNNYRVIVPSSFGWMICSVGASCAATCCSGVGNTVSMSQVVQHCAR